MSRLPKFTSNEDRKSLTETLRKCGYSEDEIKEFWAPIDPVQESAFAAFASAGGSKD